MTDEARVGAPNPGGAAGLAQVLTREPRSHEIDIANRPQLSDIASQRDRRKAPLQYPCRTWIQLAEEDRLVAGLVEAQFNAADSSEQTGDLES